MSPLNEEYVGDEHEADTKQSYIVVYVEVVNIITLRRLFALVHHEA